MKSLRDFLLFLVLLSWTNFLFSQEIPTVYRLDEVTIHGGVNPAHPVIDSVLAHAKQNNPNSLDSYRYQIYDQMVFTIDSSGVGALLDTVQENKVQSFFDEVLKRSDLMVMETFSEVLFRHPDQLRQNVLGTKMSGVKTPQMVYLANRMQSPTFYDETVSIAGTDYVNPISRNSKNHYYFSLESVTRIDDTDSLYVITFHPLPDKTFNALQGTLVIHANGWALQEVKASPNKQAGLYNIGIEQVYQKNGDCWFPKQLNISLLFPGVVADLDGYAFPMVAIGNSYITHVELNPEINDRAFSEVEVQVHEAAAYRDDAFWTQHRIDSLTERILNTYHLVDSVTRGSDVIERLLNVSNKLMDDMALSFGPIDWNIGSSFRYSFTRGWFFGLHLSTNDRLSRHFRLGGFFGYWTRLHDIDYGFEGKWLINRQRQMELGARYSHKSLTLGEFNGFGESNNPLAENEYRYVFYENVMIRSNNTEVFFNTRFARHFKAFMTFGTYQKKYLLPPYDAMPITHFTIAELKLRFAYKEKFMGTTQGIRSLGTDYPVVWLSYQHSFKDVLGGEYEFDRVKFQLEKDFQTHYIGKSTVLLQAGYASKGCPVQETFDLLGSYQLVGLYSPGSFSTMREDEFLCDRFVALFLSHDFQGTLWNPHSQWFKPQLSLVTNLAWGLPTLKHGYFESGLVVRGLLNMPMVNIGAGVFYRYGAYSFPKVIDNFAFKYSITFAF